MLQGTQPLDAEKPRPPIDWSCLPLTLSAKQPSMILLQLPDDQTDLSGDVGTVGLLKRNNDDTKPPYSVTLDLKGKVFHGAVLPSCTLLSVAITGSEAQVNSSSDSVVHLNFTSDFGEAETMEGALDESQFADLESDVDEEWREEKATRRKSKKRRLAADSFLERDELVKPDGKRKVAESSKKVKSRSNEGPGKIISGKRALTMT